MSHLKPACRPGRTPVLRLLLAGLAVLALAGQATAASHESEHEGHEQHGAGHDTDAHEAPHAYPPIGVMGGHTHHKGGWMVSYRYMRMAMEGNRDGTSRVGLDEILRPTGTYGVAPTRMDMDMHMVGVMYAPHERVTLAVMLPFLSLEMDHRTMTGAGFTTNSSGVGDLEASSLIRLTDLEEHQVHLNLGFRFPTGSIDRKDMTPASGGQNVVLPYPMQTGSGTVDFRPGVTYLGQIDRYSWGAQALGTVRIGTNDENYALGDRYHVTGWGQIELLRWVSLGARLQWEQWFNIDGEDSRIAPAASIVPTADPNLRAGRRLDVGPSINFAVREGAFQNLRLAFEALFPAYQNLDGPQLETDWTLTAGVQYSF